MTHHIAIDIGASSGRVILAEINQEKQMELKEIHRFENSYLYIDGYYRWDIKNIFSEIIKGLEKAWRLGVEYCTVGIDTWGVDYCLIDKEGQLIELPKSYRDDRTNGKMEDIFEKVPKEEIYKKTGIQFQEFNTIYQLYAEDKDLLDKTDKILMIPDYLAYLLTGKMVSEFSNASTTQLLNFETKSFDDELLAIISISEERFPELVESGTVLGNLSENIKTNYDLPDCEIISVATHDTASAIVGVPALEEDWLYLSSGTWSLFGIENNDYIITNDSLNANYSNELGAYNTVRFLKNIPGMWFIQEISRNLNNQYSYEEIALEANKVEPLLQIIDLDDNRFSNPENMIEEIQEYCAERNLVIPKTIGELAMAIYSNLARTYGEESKRIEKMVNKKIKTIHIVGGGSSVDLLNQLTANSTNKKVVAGPIEATAIGNIMGQLIAVNIFENISEARKWLINQVEVKVYLPK